MQHDYTPPLPFIIFSLSGWILGPLPGGGSPVFIGWEEAGPNGPGEAGVPTLLGGGAPFGRPKVGGKGGGPGGNPPGPDSNTPGGGGIPANPAGGGIGGKFGGGKGGRAPLKPGGGIGGPPKGIDGGNEIPGGGFMVRC